MKTYHNILIVRTDRIGDVLLTTPSLEALRKYFPSAKISVLVSEQTREILEGNPHIDEVIVDDRKGRGRGFWGFWKQVGEIKKRKFDLAIIFHTKKRTNLLCFHAGIPERVGYENNKFGFLLTRKIKDTRAQGVMHEYQYCLEVLRHLGAVSDAGPKLFMPKNQEAEVWAQKVFKDAGLDETVIAIHPNASCISKRWPPEQFAQLINFFSEGVSFVLLGSKDNGSIAEQIKRLTRKPILDLTGKINLHQLASVLRRCQLLISNDSGPVHMAVAVGTPVISLFGRKQPGLSPNRWRPLGPKDMAIHKEVGCEICLAHNCKIDFECVKAITPQEVFEAAKNLLTPIVSSS